MSKKQNWVWMPHSAHLVVGHYCRFHLATYVGGYIVSTVGEYWPERIVRDIRAEVENRAWYAANRRKVGDAFNEAFMEKFGYEEIGAGRLYETMVFKAAREKDANAQCCPWRIVVRQDMEMRGYNDPEEAYKGHLKLCEKWQR